MILSLILLTFLSCSQPSTAFLPSPDTQNARRPATATATPTTATTLHMVTMGKNYKPKWKKLKTLSDSDSTTKTPPSQIGLTGTVPVVFRMGNETKTTMATVGDPLVDIASQAGQYIKYGCGKGECGSCECLAGGQWIRPCVAVVPPDFDVEGTGQYVITVKGVKNKSRSSGKFYSVKSFLMGFYNNVLGMAGMVITRRAAKKNYNERIDYEDMVKQKVLEKKRLAGLEEKEGTLRP